MQKYEFVGGSLDGISISMPEPPIGTEFRLPPRKGQASREIYAFRKEGAFVLSRHGQVPFAVTPSDGAKVIPMNFGEEPSDAKLVPLAALSEIIGKIMMPALSRLDDFCERYNCYLPPMKFERWTLYCAETEEGDS